MAQEQGPREPLDEMRAKIEEACAEIKRLRAIVGALTRYVRVNVLSVRNDPYLATIVEQAEYTVKGERRGE